MGWLLKTLIVCSGIWFVVASAWAIPVTETPVARIRVTYGDQKSQFLITKNKAGTGTLKASLNEADESSRVLSADDIAYIIESLNQVEPPRKGEQSCARANIKADYVSNGRAEVRTTCLLRKAGVRQRLVAIADLLATRMTRGPAKLR